MFIQTEHTPNPNTLKFMPGVDITGGAPINFTDRASVSSSELAGLLFDIEHVTAVFLGFDFITITKDDQGMWDLMKPEIMMTIMDYLVSGRPAVSEPRVATQDAGDEDEIVKQIKELIEVRVRPAVAQDGGDIVFIGYEDGIVKLELHGSCSGCPSSSITLKNGIETMLRHYVPEIIAVEAVN